MMRTQVGAIIEIPLDGEKAYAQVTHFHEKWGYLLRVFVQRFVDRPSKFDDLVRSEVQFSIFYPVPKGVKLGLISIVANVAVPAETEKLPIFKASFPGVGLQDPDKWWLWDGKHEWRLSGRLSKEQLEYPYRAIVTGDTLHRFAREGWKNDDLLE